MPAIRFLKASLNWFRIKTSSEHRYYLAVTEMVLTGEYDRLRQFLEQERAKARLDGGQTRGMSAERQAIHLARVEKDYTQFFESFASALKSRRKFQNHLLDRKWVFPFTKIHLEKKQARIERLITSVPGRKSRSQSIPISGLSRDFLFEKALRRKRVLVVGPSPTAEVDRALLERFDVVVMPKLYGDLSLGNGVELSERHTVVTYYNHGTVKKLEAEVPDRRPLWHFCRVKSVTDVESVRVLYATSIDEPRQIGLMASPEPLMNNYYGAFMGTAMLYDLLLRRPSQLFLTGFTFFVQADAAYRPTYDSSQHSDKLLVTSLRAHGAVSNFLFVKNLFKFGTVQADSAVAEILNLTPEKYAEMLDKRFSRHI